MGCSGDMVSMYVDCVRYFWGRIGFHSVCLHAVENYSLGWSNEENYSAYLGSVLLGQGKVAVAFVGTCVAPWSLFVVY